MGNTLLYSCIAYESWRQAIKLEEQLINTESKIVEHLPHAEHTTTLKRDMTEECLFPCLYQSMPSILFSCLKTQGKRFC